jgi:hypothetical protein
MRIVSIDVGIKNLAYCIIEKSAEEIPYIIHEWDIINILGDESCSYCDNENIKITCKFMDKKINFCKEHKNNHKKLLLDWDKIKENINECVDNSCLVCNKKSKWLLNNNYYCTIHKNSIIKKNDKELVATKFKAKKVKSINADDLKLLLIQILDNNKQLLDVDHVCIENQPSFKNPKMKGISDTIYTWFLIRGKIDKNITGIHFISPSNKLKIPKYEEEINKEINESKNKYKTTKELSIKHCYRMLKDNQEYTKKLDDSKKIDDLCDTWLQGIYFFNNIKKYN